MTVVSGRFIAVLLFSVSVLESWTLTKISTLSNQISLHSNFRYSVLRDTTLCKTVAGLTKPQLEICYQQPNTTAAALEGLWQAIKECQYQFQGHRWNCSSLATNSRVPYTSAMMKYGYRETAFAYALSSAGVTISVARACSQGKLTNCGCNPQKYRKQAASTWKWGGCSDNLKFGVRFSKMFLDVREKSDDIHSKVNLHNNEVGRTTVSNNLQTKCKCHGMSGSCVLKTCWRTVPDYRLIGKVLKEKYRSAVPVEQSNLENRPPKNIRTKSKKQRKKPRARFKQWIPQKKKAKRELAQDLLYYQKSPNYCDADKALDIAGVSGRVCNRTSYTSDSCSSLCCGRGYNDQRTRRTERCNCKFHYCCTVECQTCVVEEWIAVCN